MNVLEADVRHRLRVAINAQPELLLESDGGPVGLKADVFFADLIGHDDQIDHEWTISSAAPKLRVPIRERALAALREDVMPDPSIHTTTYALQSNYATLTVADEVAFSAGWDVRGGPPAFQTKVVLLRYRRR